MGKRWVVHVDTIRNYANELSPRYLRVRPDEQAAGFITYGKAEAVTPPHATLYKTKREATAAADKSGLTYITVKRKDW